MFPIAVYGKGTSFPTLREEYKLRAFEGRQELTRNWRTLLLNEKFFNVYSLPDVVTMNTSTNMRCTKRKLHTACTG